MFKLVIGGIEKLRKGEILFEDWLEVHNKMNSQHRRVSSNISAKNGQQKQLNRFQGYKLNKIKRADYQLFINELLFEYDYAKNTVDRIHGEMMVMINSAVEHDELEKNLLRGIQISKEEEEKTVFLNKQEVMQLLKVIDNEAIFKRVMVITLLHTGIRSGELLGLFWSDIDFENKTLTVDRQRTRQGLGPPKSKSSYRTITIEDDLINELKAYKEWQEKNGKINANYFKSDYILLIKMVKSFIILNLRI
ncbi:site-specific integrase [Lysinibacillus xylanilyticus]|nr:site-specific integrase [Lysinibacillus xylanilyticus]